LFLLAGTALAQDQPQTGQGQRQNMRAMDWQNMDPQEIQKFIQQRILDALRDRLQVTDDAEWKIIGDRITKVIDARMATISDSGIGGLGPMGAGGPGGGRGFQAIFGQPGPEYQALKQAIDAKASVAEIKDKLARFQAARKAKQAAVTKAQNDLREVLTLRQEAILISMGALE
jgi:hypothetical protein